MVAGSMCKRVSNLYHLYAMKNCYVPDVMIQSGSLFSNLFKLYCLLEIMDLLSLLGDFKFR